MTVVSPRAVAALALLAVSGAAGAGTAAAQTVDYGALEQMFGEPVTMSVTGKPQRATDAPANIEIITQDDIRRSGATTIPKCSSSFRASMSAATGSPASMSACAATTRCPIRTSWCW